MTEPVQQNEPAILNLPQPGYLLAPFGWAACPLLEMTGTDRTLTAQLLQISRARMHLIALALAHCDINKQKTLSAELLLRGSPRQIAHAVLKRCPPGLERALEHLPIQVLPFATYRYLVELLEESAVRKLIQHAPYLSREYIDALYEIPRPLRRVAALVKRELGVELEGLGAGLRILAERGAAASFDALVTQLVSARQPAQFVALVRNLVLHLPVSIFTPAETIGGAHRVDDIDYIRRLAKQWKNCLGGIYAERFLECRAALYLWPDKNIPAAIVTTWHGRLGWTIEDAKGPENIDLPASRLDEIHRAFAAAGIPRCPAIGSLQMIANSAFSEYARQRRQRRAPDQDAIDEFEREEVFEEFEAALDRA